MQLRASCLLENYIFQSCTRNALWETLFIILLDLIQMKLVNKFYYEISAMVVNIEKYLKFMHKLSCHSGITLHDYHSGRFFQKKYNEPHT